MKSNSRKIAAAGILLTVIVGCWFGLERPGFFEVLLSVRSSSETALSGNIYLKDQNGNPPKGDFKNKKILLHFWASWCAPCLEELPKLFLLKEIFQSDQIAIVTVSLDSNWPDAQSILKRTNAPPESEGLFFYFLDAEKKFADSRGTFQLPETYFLEGDREVSQQKVKAKWVGATDWKDPELIQLLKSLVNPPKTE